MKNLEKIFDFLNIARDLKKTYRYGASTKDIHRDTSADHSWRVALMAFMLAEELKLDIDVLKAVKLALVHDLPEAINGDVDYRLIVSGEESVEKKYINELAAMEKFKNTLSSPVGEELYDLWIEFEEKKTREAKFVNALDKMECSTHCLEEGSEKWDAPELIPVYGDSPANDFPELKKFNAVLKKRLKEEFLKGGLEWKKEYDS